MNIDATLEALRPRLSASILRQHGPGPFAVQVDGGPHLEWRFLETVDALVLTVPLGRLLRVRLREAGLRLLLANLFLAEAGRPHYALEPNEDLVCLCQTVPADLPSASAPLWALRDLLAAWAPTRLALRDLQVID